MASVFQPGFSLAEAGILQAKETKFVFRPFCHNRTDAFIRKLSAGGLWGFLARGSQSEADTLSFKQKYHPNAEQVFLQTGDIPRNTVSFDFGDAYAPYNWELFFHIPMTIAGKLVRDQKFEQAPKWYHVIFDPTASETGGKQRFWQFLPFYQEAGKQIKTLNELLADGTALLQQINLWEKNPFKPHIIARMRLGAYMKHVVMKYLDCLIGWADNLFGRDTLESINEAVNLYILAAKILGPRPERVPARAEPVDQTYNTLKAEKWLPLSNALVAIENFIPPSAGKGFHGWHADEPGTLHKQAVKAMETMLYFSIIRNDKLLSYWDTVADRLFKIRHSMNIAGVERTLALFEPPIDPALLVKAAAAGLDLGTVLNEVSGTARPVYRFAVMIQKARQFAQDLKLLGHDLLGYLEKRDAEGLALLRQNQDIEIMDSIQAIREANVEETRKRAASIQISLDAARGRRKFFSERTLTNASEQGYLASLQSALDDIGTQKITETIASVVAAIPDFKIGAPTSVGTTFGGTNLAKATMAIASYYSGGVGQSNIEGARAAAMGGYERRMDDWKMQAESAKKEVEQLDNELLVSSIRREVSEHELATHNLHRAHSRALYDYLTRMFTAQELYDYLTGEVSAIYFQGYQLAVGMARKAQACYMRELGDTGASFIGFSYWDSLKKGLLAAERLVGDINRMEAAYLDNNKRNEFELTKHISLGLLDPARLAALKTAGTARFCIPELLFDLDYPGHYMRRIKSVSVSIYCVTGPFTTVNATLRLVRHYTRTRLDTVAGDHYQIRPEDYQTGGESIATSGAQNDAGLFSCNFNDDRYLPFEGCGAVSEWDVMLVTEHGLRQFDYRTISDVVLHLKYTAREQAAAREAVMERMTAELAKVADQAMPLYSFINVRTELSGEWASLLHPQPGAGHIITVPLDSNLFPYLARTSQTVIGQIGLYSIVKTGAGIPWTVSCRQGGEPVSFDASLPVNRGSGLYEQTVNLPDNTCLDDIDEGKLQIWSDTPIQPQDLADLIVTVQVRIAS